MCYHFYINRYIYLIFIYIVIEDLDEPKEIIQRNIDEDDICPICQENFREKRQNVTFCKSALFYIILQYSLIRKFTIFPTSVILLFSNTSSAESALFSLNSYHFYRYLYAPNYPKRPITIVCPYHDFTRLENRQACGNSVHVICMKIWAEHQRSQESKAAPSEYGRLDDAVSCPMCRGHFGLWP